MDLFEEYLNKKNELDIVKIALTDKSYKDIYREENHEELPNEKVNSDLGTVGDSILRMCLTMILYESKEPEITTTRQKYESDRFLVSVIAYRYALIDYINKNSKVRIDSYDYDNNYKEKVNAKEENKRKNVNEDNYCKYIATCVEAIIAAIYYEECKVSIDNAFNKLIKLFRTWIDLL